MKTLLLPALFAALAQVAAAQQPPAVPADPAATAAPLLRNQAVAVDHFTLLQRDDDGDLVGRGDAYRARFVDGGMRFEPALPTAPSLQHLALRATHTGRGELHALPQAPAPLATGRRVRYERGAVTEAYDVRGDGVEQSFVFDSLPPGDGDLVVQLAVDSTLPQHESGADHVVFAGEHGGVRIGGVVGIDKNGERVRGTLTSTDGRIELRLPATFVNRAALPLVLDPLVNTFTVTTYTTSGLGRLEASYDATTGKYAIVWALGYYTTNHELRFAISNGSALGNTPVLGVITTTATTAPFSVADNSYRNCFVVAWTEVLTNSGTPPTWSGVRGRILNTNGTLGTAMTIAGNPSVPHSAPQLLSSSQTNTASMKFVCIHDGTFAQAELWNLVPDPSGVLISSGMVTVSDPARTCTAVGISKVEDLNHDFLVCWSESNNVLNQHVLRGATFDAAGVMQTTPLQAVNSGPIDLIRVDGGGARQSWAIAVGFEQTIPDYLIPEFFRIWVDPGHPTSLRSTSYTALSSNLGTICLDIASTQRLIHTIHWSFTAGHCLSSMPNCNTSDFGTYNHEGCTLCSDIAQLHSIVWGALIRPRAYGDTSASPDAVKLAWHDYGNWLYTNSEPIKLADFTPADGAVTNLGGACGPYANSASSQCARVGGIAHEAVLNDLPQNISCFLVVGTERADLGGCGSCVLVPDPFTSFVFGPLQRPAAEQTVSQSFTIPADTGLIGFRLYEQWLVQNSTNPACATWSLDLSNALRVTIE